MREFSEQTRSCGCTVQVQRNTQALADVTTPCPTYQRLMLAVRDAREQSHRAGSTSEDDDRLSRARSALGAHFDERSIVVNTYSEHCVMAGERAPETPELVDGEWIVTDDNGERRHDRDVYAGPASEIADSARYHNVRAGMYHSRLALVLNEALMAEGYPSAFTEDRVEDEE